MLAEDTIQIADARLELLVERHVALRTWGKIQELRVEMIGGRLQVCGSTSSNYLRQLALTAVREALGLDPIPVDFLVEFQVDFPVPDTRKLRGVVLDRG